MTRTRIEMLRQDMLTVFKAYQRATSLVQRERLWELYVSKREEFMREDSDRRGFPYQPLELLVLGANDVE